MFCAQVTSGSAQVEEAEELNRLNIPYLHYYGFGRFQAGDREVGVLRFLVQSTVQPHAGRALGVALRFSGSFARLRGTAEDESDQGIVSVVPGIEFRFPMGELSLLRVAQDLGGTFDVDGGSSALLSLTGMSAEFVRPAGRFELAVTPGAAFAAAISSDQTLRDETAVLFARADARHPLWFDLWANPAEAGGYVELFHYWADSERAGTPPGLQNIGSQVEVGVTFGTNPNVKILFFRPLLNVGVRFGEGFRGLRFTFTDRVLRLPPR